MISPFFLQYKESLDLKLFFQPLFVAGLNLQKECYTTALNASFEKIKDKIQIDVGVGDVVEPLTREIPLVQYHGKPLFESTVSLHVYPIETVFAEKLETVLSKGSGNSRMKDYHDLIFLLRNKKMFNLVKLRESIKNTFSNRGTIFLPIAFDESAKMVLQKLWSAHCKGLGEHDLPLDIEIVIDEINQFVVSVFGNDRMGAKAAGK